MESLWKHPDLSRMMANAGWWEGVERADGTSRLIWEMLLWCSWSQKHECVEPVDGVCAWTRLYIQSPSAAPRIDVAPTLRGNNCTAFSLPSFLFLGGGLFCRANVEVDTSWIRFVCSAQFVENIDLLFVFRCVAQLTVEGLSFSIALHHVLVI